MESSACAEKAYIDEAAPSVTEPLQLLCPKCRSTLPWIESSSLVCSGCSASYPVEDQIPIIRENNDYYHELLPKDLMHELIRRSRVVNWRVALAEQIAKAPEPKRRALHTVFVDESRAAFKAIMPPLENQRVLDLGCGSGVTSIGLARWAREVVSCDLTFERVAFLAMRVREMGLTNVRAICAGDTRPLPFADSSFDCAILNGVLEWSAADGDDPVRERQIAFLAEVRRILKPGGHLYVGIENRYGYPYFFGYPEDHTGVKYAALAPRWIADVLVRRANGHPYRTYTYGYAGMRKLLNESGFRSARFFAPIPDYRNFQELYALDVPSARENRSGETWRSRVQHTLERNRRFTPSYGVVASPESARRSWIEELVDEIDRRLSFGGDRGFPRVRVSATSTPGLIITLGRDAIVRVPLDLENEGRVTRNFLGLARAEAISAFIKGFVAPRALLSDKLHGVPYAVESFVGGTGYAVLSAKQKERADRIVFDVLLDLKSYCDSASDPPRSEEVWEQVVNKPLHELVSRLPSNGERHCVGELLKVAEELAGDELPVAFTHGDLWWGNLLFDDVHVRIGLIDWDRWAEHDLATHDFLHFVCYRRVLRTQRKWAEVLSEWLADTGADALEVQATRQFARQLGMRDGWKLQAGLAYWVREVTAHQASKLQLDHAWSSSMFAGLPSTLLALAGATGRAAP